VRLWATTVIMLAQHNTSERPFMSQHPARRRRLFRNRFGVCLLLAGALTGVTPLAADDAADALIQRLSLRQAVNPVAERADWRKPKRIIVPAAPAERLAALREIAMGAELIPVRSLQEAVERADRADVIIGYCSQALLARAERVTWIQLSFAGAERCVAAMAATRRTPLLTNMQRIAAPQIAEHAIAMMLSLTRGLPRYAALQREGAWRQRAVPNEDMWEIDGKTLLVVGLGGIGSEIAWRADALGMSVLATRASSRQGPPYVDYVGLADELPVLAQRADVVINATPLTAQTRGVFDRGFFKQMKSDAYFINVGRGGSVVTADLVSALADGELAGAGLDVTEPEPLPVDHPLWSMANVIITPHVAGASDLRGDRTWTLIRENLRRYVAGEPMLSVVNIERGY
jgi:phosphoglycerate dehydrogenase-like enzyme